MPHRDPNSIKDGISLLSILGLLLRIAPTLFCHPEFLQGEPSRIRNNHARSFTVAYANHAVDRSSIQKPLLFG